MQPSTQFSLALVTGASSGIGAALCRLLASQGIPLLVTGRDPVRLQELVDELQKIVNVTAFVADLKNEKDRQVAIAKIHAYSPDLVINNAGFGLYGESLSFETRAQVDLLNVNAAAVLELTLEAARAMLAANKKGVILNVSSAAGQLIFPNFAVYSASKAFVTNLSQSLDFELQPRGVRILVACPGVVKTSFRERASGMHMQSNSEMSMSAEFAANKIWQQILDGKRMQIFDWKTRLGIFLSQFLPKKWLAHRLAARIETYHPARPLITKPRNE